MLNINARFLAQRVTGVQRYAHEIVKRFPGDEYLLRRPPEKYTNRIIGNLWEQFVLPKELNAGDLLWSPGNVGPLSVENQVITIHDVATFEYPEWFSGAFSRWYRWLLPRLVQRVQHIIVVSEFTKSRLIKLLSVSDRKISVIPNGVDARYKQLPLSDVTRVRHKYNLPELYVLYVGSLEPRKNIKRLLKAWNKVYKSVAPVQMVVVGTTGDVFRKESLSDITPGVEFIGYVDEVDLPGLYNGAEVFIYPSLYEGFGLPVLEAMACGTPVIASKREPLSSIAGDSAMLVDPLSVDEMSETLRALLGDGNARRELSAKGRVQAACFDWEKSAKDTWSLLQRLS